MSKPVPKKSDFDDEYKFLLEEFKICVNVQMHFNDMLLKIRTLVITFIISIFGTAAFLLSQDLYFNIFNFPLHSSVFIILFGIVLSLGICILDYFYYYKMLIGAVQRSYDIKEKFEENKNNPLELFKLPIEVRDAIGKEGKSKNFVLIFYGLIIAIGVVFILFTIFFYSKI